MPTTLKTNELQELIDRYNSELRKLEFQKESIIEVIQKLKKKLKKGDKNKEKISAKKTVKVKDTAPKRRGRPRKIAATPVAEKPKAKRGRPKKVTPIATTPAEKTTPKQRGRPKKIATPTAVPSTAPKRRGRPKKTTTPAAVTPATAPKKRGRPKKVATAPAKTVRTAPAKTVRTAPAKVVRTAPAKATSTAPKKRRGRPKKQVVAKTPAKKTVTPKSKAKPAKKPIALDSSGRKARSLPGYRLSEWDTFILSNLEKAGKTLISDELYELAVTWNKDEKLGLTEPEIKGKLTRSVHKLANKRKELVKVPRVGRGFSYALTTWMGPKGIKKKYAK